MAVRLANCDHAHQAGQYKNTKNVRLLIRRVALLDAENYCVPLCYFGWRNVDERMSRVLKPLSVAEN